MKHGKKPKQSDPFVVNSIKKCLTPLVKVIDVSYNETEVVMAIYKASQLKRKENQHMERVTRGIYTDSDEFDFLMAFIVRYPQAIITLKTALQVYAITDDYVKAPYDLAFKRGNRSIQDSKIKQVRLSPRIFDLGKTVYRWHGLPLPIYDQERLLIELFRFDDAVDKETYKGAIYYYRKRVIDKQFSIPKFKDYAEHFPNKQSLLLRLSMEVL